MLGDEQSIDIERGVSIKLANGANKNLAVDGSVTPVEFVAMPNAGEKWRVTRMVGYLEGANPFSSEKFADLLELANGVDVVMNGTVITTWNTNRDIASQIPVLTAPKALGKEDRTLAGEWDIVKAFGKALLVDDRGIKFVINDNLSTLASFTIQVQGQRV
jgi:hypothetical protein